MAKAYMGGKRAKEARDIASIVRNAQRVAQARVGLRIGRYEIIALVGIGRATGARRAAGDWAMGDPIYLVRSDSGDEQKRYSEIGRPRQ